jgi:hypothetical protein
MKPFRELCESRFYKEKARRLSGNDGMKLGGVYLKQAEEELRGGFG